MRVDDLDLELDLDLGDDRPLLLGLVGSGISGSLSKPLHEREGRACGLSLTYRPVDADVLGFGADDLPDVLRWAGRLGFDGLNVTHPFKRAVVPLLDHRSDAVDALGAANTVVIRDGRTTGYNTDWSGFAQSLRRSLPDPAGQRAVLLGAGGAGVAVGYALLQLGLAHVAVHDVDRDRAAAFVERFADDVRRRPALRGRGPGRRGRGSPTAWCTRRRPGCSATPACRCRPSWCDPGSGSPTSCTSRSTPSWSGWPAAAAAASYRGAAWPCSRPPPPSSCSPGGSRTPSGCCATSTGSPRRSR